MIKYIEHEKLISEINERLRFLREENGRFDHYTDGFDKCVERVKDFPAAEPLNDLAREIHENAVAHGWWEEDRGFPEIVALCHSELSEALEEYRNGRATAYTLCQLDGKPCEGITCDSWCTFDGSCNIGEITENTEGIAVEMIDCIIRILDWCAKEGIDVDRILREKCEYNKNRPYRHGGKLC